MVCRYDLLIVSENVNKMLKQLKKNCEEHRMKIKVNKTRQMVIELNEIAVDIKIGKIKLELKLSSFRYMRNEDMKCEKEIVVE